MPGGNLVRIPTSLSRGGTTLTNLRGVLTSGNALDYTGKYIPTTSDILQVTSAFQSNSAAWTSTIRYAFEPVSESNTPYISYGSIILNESNATFLFRVLCNPLVNSNTGFILLNGNTEYYGLFYLYYDPSSSNIDFAISENVNYNYAFFRLNSSSINPNQWYHYGVKLTTSNSNTTVDWWENGVKQAGCNLGWEYLVPTSGETKLFNDNTNFYPFYGKLTDIVLMNGNPLSDDQMAAFGSAPFV